MRMHQEIIKVRENGKENGKEMNIEL